MKNFLFILAFAFGMLLSTGASAQALTMTGSGDTCTNTGTKTATLKVTSEYTTVSIHVVLTKLSGTAAGTVTLQGSLDGTNYVTIDTMAVLNNKNTYTVTNTATQSKVFIVRGTPYLWFRVSYTGSGTMSVIQRAYILPRK